MWAWIRKFFSWETAEEFNRRITQSAYDEGVSIVNAMRVQTGSEGAMRFEIPEHAVKSLWQKLHGLNGFQIVQGMRDRLEELGYPEPDAIDRAIQMHEEKSRSELSEASRTRACFKLASLSPIISDDAFFHELDRITSPHARDPAYRIWWNTVRKSGRGPEEVAKMRSFVESFNKFANPRPRTMEAFLATRENTVNN